MGRKHCEWGYGEWDSTECGNTGVHVGMHVRVVYSVTGVFFF
jgi:hypothetical protein